MTTTTAQRTIRRESEGWVEPIGRIGVASQGVLYAVVGILALQVASGHEGNRADQHGALYAVSSQPFGRALLLVLTVGLAAHCVWRFALFLRGDRGSEDAKDKVKRVGQLGRAFVYAGFTWAAAKVLFESDAGGGASREGVSRALEWPAGPLLVGVVGVVVIATGLWHLSKLITRRYERDLDREDGQGARVDAPDLRSDLGVRRSRHAVRHDDQPLAHRLQLRTHQRFEPVQ